MASDPISSIASLVETSVNKIWPDAGEAEKQKVDLLLQVLQQQLTLTLAEINSDSWLAKNWRPLTMVTFLALIVARWLGLSAPGISDAEYLKLWDIIQLSLGGYTLGRSAEKIVPSLAKALKK